MLKNDPLENKDKLPSFDWFDLNHCQSNNQKTKPKAGKTNYKIVIFESCRLGIKF